MDIHVTKWSHRKSPKNQFKVHRQRSIQHRAFQPWLQKTGCATNAPNMPIVLKVFVFAKTDGMAMASSVLITVVMIQFGILIDVNQSVQTQKRTKVLLFSSFAQEGEFHFLFLFSAEIAPFCHSQGCTCPTGYELIETITQRTCRLIEKEEVSTEDEGDKCMYSEFTFNLAFTRIDI